MKEAKVLQRSLMMSRLLASLIVLYLLMTSGYANQTAHANPATNSLPRYDLSIRLMPDARRLEATGTMRLPATNFARNSFELSLSELMEDFRVEIVSPTVSAGVARLDARVRPYSRPGWGTTTWTIRPPRPIPPNEPVLLRFSYAGGGERTSFIFSLGAEACFGAGIATAWYPELEAFPVESDGRLRGLRGTGTLNFSVPRGYLVHAQGIQRKTPGEMSQGTFQFEINSPVFFSFAAGRYTVRRRSGTLPIALYLLRPRENADSYINGSARVLNALTQEFGDYPHSEFAIVEVPTAQGEQAGFAGASLDGFIISNTEFLDKDFNAAYFGHEISHQWWGSLIRARAVAGRWMLSEGMAQYGSLRAVEMLEGITAAERYRRTGYPGYISDQNALGYFTLAAQGTDHRLSDLPQEGNLSRALSNSKGFIVVDMLSRTIGRRRFSRILQNFIREHAYQQVTWNEFLRAIEAGAGRNLRWFYGQWFERTGAPDFQLTWRQEGRRVRGVIAQTSPYYQAALEIEAKNNQGQRLVRTVKIRRAETTFSFPVNFRVKTVTLDPNYLVLRWTPEYRTAANTSRPSQ